jgi:hypothetical protein
MIFDSTIRTLYWCAVFCTFFLSYYRIGFFPPSNYIAILIVYIFILKMLISRDILFKNFQIIYYTIFISLIVALTMAIGGSLFSEIAYRLMKSFGTGLILSMTAFYITITYGIKSASKPLLIFATLTSIVGILQSLDVNFAWSLRESMGYSEDYTVKYQIQNRLRIPGLAFYSTTLSYQLLVAFSLLMINMKYNINYVFAKISINYIIIILIYSAIILSGGRSVFPVLILLLYVIYSENKGWNRSLLLILILGSTFLFFYLNNELFNRLTSIGIGGRFASIYNGFQLLLFEPFGIGNDTGRFKEIILSKSFNVTSTFLYPHNHFISAGLKFGLLPVFVYIAYNFALILRIYFALKSYRISIILAILLYQLNTFFHNGGMLLGEQNGWYMYGIIEAILILERRSKKYELNEMRRVL